ncbi:MAG: hypothetical protein K0R90_1091 [Oscillospiraceae bacterium]|jgi:uncharacterized protein YeeX (DUF496 family)|nr:hypothetical protein [Oscillospiraceae bacterium]
MELALKTLSKPISLILSRTQKKENQLIEDLNDIKAKIENCRNRFDLALDDDLIDYCIFEMEALQSKYRYLLRQAREQKLSCAVIDQMKNERMGQQLG